MVGLCEGGNKPGCSLKSFVRGAQCDVHSWQCIPLPFGVRNHALFELTWLFLITKSLGDLGLGNEQAKVWGQSIQLS
ncbi:hypothetical protein ANN_06784 [Periplaneta americana]|uniref:Per a allergen n=1 Tax=Periplaneta americana TaxID=6978 RepID=A0ABQ8TEL0_PERAM|nr:hypothetical protein ANN_06784 [Periplaneta americana]